MTARFPRPWGRGRSIPRASASGARTWSRPVSLRSYLLDAYSARKLGGKSTGNAARGAGQASAVSPMNLYLMPRAHSLQDIIGSVEDGFYVTELMGFGVNLVTGDYSRGAAGMWIEKGELAFPVAELTIAGNLNDMLNQIENGRQRPPPAKHHCRPHGQGLAHDRGRRIVWCLTNTLMKLRGHFGCRQGAMTSSGQYHARKSNAADGQKDPQIRKRICETPH